MKIEAQAGHWFGARVSIGECSAECEGVVCLLNVSEVENYSLNISGCSTISVSGNPVCRFSHKGLITQTIVYLSQVSMRFVLATASMINKHILITNTLLCASQLYSWWQSLNSYSLTPTSQIQV